MEREHNYKLTVKWVGNKGVGTADYHSYKREQINLQFLKFKK